MFGVAESELSQATLEEKLPDGTKETKFRRFETPGRRVVGRPVSYHIIPWKWGSDCFRYSCGLDPVKADYHIRQSVHRADSRPT